MAIKSETMAAVERAGVFTAEELAEAARLEGDGATVEAVEERKRERVAKRERLSAAAKRRAEAERVRKAAARQLLDGMSAEERKELLREALVSSAVEDGLAGELAGERPRGEFDFRNDVIWVYRHLSGGVTELEACKHPDALALLKWVKENARNRTSFFQTLLPKVLNDGKGGESESDWRAEKCLLKADEVHEILERYREIPDESERTVEEVAEAAIAESERLRSEHTGEVDRSKAGELGKEAGERVEVLIPEQLESVRDQIIRNEEKLRALSRKVETRYRVK